MTTLSGQLIQDSFSELLKINGNSLTTVLQPVEDGDGNTTPLMLSTIAMSLNGLQWPAINGGLGAILQISNNNLLTWTVADLNPVVPVATSSTLGGVIPGSQFVVDSLGNLSISPSYVPYILPTASATTIGGIQVGSNLTITNGVLSANAYTLPIASTTHQGGVVVGSGLNVDINGIITVPTASTTQKGSVIIGAGLSVDINGVVSIPPVTTASGSSSLSPGNVLYSASNPGTGFISIATPQIYSLTDTTFANIVSLFPNNEWTTLAIGNSAVVTKLLKCTLSNRLFAVAGLQIATSIDSGITWTIQTLSEQFTCISGTISDSAVNYVAGCVSGNFASSSDGINWTINVPATPELVHAIAYSSPYVASTYGTNNAQVSTDGVTWTPLAAPVTIDRFVTRSNGSIVGAALYGNQCYQFNQSNTTFTTLGSAPPAPFLNLTQFQTATYFSSSLSSSSITIYSTTDFVNYTPIVIPINSETSVQVTDMYWTADNQLIVATNTDIIMVSTDGANFTVVSSGVPAAMSNVVDANDIVFFMSATANAVYAYTPLDYDITSYFQVPAMPTYFPSYIPYLKL
jgi:hypothetical protein